MNLYLISQKATWGYDTYDAAVVAAETLGGARRIRPDNEKWGDKDSFGEWAYNVKDVHVKLIGVAAPGIKAGVVLASYHAG